MSIRILFVDDELRTGSSGQSYMNDYVDELREFGNFDVVTADGPDRALELLSSQAVGREFQVAILDVMMPPGTQLKRTSEGVSTGIELAKEIFARWPKIKIVILSNMAAPKSAYGEASTFQGLRKGGVVQEVLFKLDKNPEDLLEVVRDLLKKRGS